MKAKDLRNSILQLAVQGKLVQQNPKDEPVSILLQKIKAEKEKLIKEKKIKKQKPLPAISEEEKPFQIPDTWEWVRLGEISINIHYGFNASAKNYGNSKLLRITDIQNNKVNWGSVPYCNTTEREFCSYGLNKRDILIARTGGTIGKSFIVNNLTQKSVFASYLIRIIPVDNQNELYLKLFLECPLYWEQLKLKSMGTGQPNVNGTSLKSLFVPLPPLQEQKRIVEKIDEIMPFIDEYDKLENKLTKLEDEFPEKLKKSILQYAVQGKLVQQNPEDKPASVLLQKIKAEKEKLIKEKKIKKQKPLPPITEEEKPFKIPDSWEWVRLGEIIILTSGQDKKNSDYNDQNKGIPYITGASNISDNEIIINRWIEKPTSVAYKNDILLTCKGTVGTTIILKEKMVHIARQIMSIRTYGINGTNFIKIFIDTYVQKLKNKALSIIPGISRNDILSISFPLPPLEEQKRIVKKVEELMNYCDILSDKNKLKEYKEPEIPEETLIAARGEAKKKDLEAAKRIFDKMFNDK